jgi:hypothetical protein
MRTVSDEICREYGLSVIENGGRGKSKHYAEWQAEKNGKPTWRSTIQKDVDACISDAVTADQCFGNLKKLGYEIKFGKDISVRPPGKERFVRLARNFGDDYTMQAIRRRIAERPGRGNQTFPDKAKRIRHSRPMSKQTRRKVGGFIGLYWHYRYLLGNVPKRGSPRQTSFHLKEDLMKLDKINMETKLLVREHIETAEQLFSYRDTCTQEIETLTAQRDRHRLDYRIAKTPEEKESARAKVHAATSEIKKLRKEVCRGEPRFGTLPSR